MPDRHIAAGPKQLVRLRVGALMRSRIYQPTAVLLAILLAPSLSWLGSGFNAGSSSAPFQASAQVVTGGCGPFRANAIIQQNFCPNGVFYARDLWQLETDAVNTYLAEHNLPASDAHLIYDNGWADLRDAIRGTMFNSLAAIINKATSQRSAHEQALYNWLQNLVQQNEMAEYTEALNEFHRWQSDPCGFKLDPEIASQYGLSYSGWQFCASPLNQIFAGPPVPAESYFTGYGLKNSYGAPANQYPHFATRVANTQLSQGEIFGIGFSAGAVVGVGASGAVAGFSSSLFPLAFGSNIPELVASGEWVVNSATAAGLGVGETVGVFAGTAAIILVAIAIGVDAGMQAFSDQQIIDDVNNLNNTLSQVTQNKPDLSAFTRDTSGLGTYKLNETFVAQTLPDYPSTAAAPDHKDGKDPAFAVTPEGGNSAADTATEGLSYQDWNGLSWTAYTSGGWFIQACKSGAKCAEWNGVIASIHYVDWSGTKYTASRIGKNFVLTKGNPAATDHACPADEARGITPGTDFSSCLSYLSSSIPLTAADGTHVSVRLTLAPSFTSPTTLNVTTYHVVNTPISATGIPAPTISLTSALPAGFTFGDAYRPTLSYAFAPPGTYQVSFSADNGFAKATQTVTIHVITQLSITSPATLTGTGGLPVNFLVTTTGDLPIKLSIDPVFVNGTGFSFTDNGNGTATIQGTLAGNSSGIFCVNINNTPCGITATNASGSVTQAFGISLSTPPAAKLVGPANVTFSAGAPNSVLLLSQGAITPVYWAFNEFGRAPSWVTFHNNGDGTGLLSATPPQGLTGSFTFTLLPVARGTIPWSTDFTINVQDLPGFLTSSVAGFTVGTAGSFEIQTNGPPAIDNDATLPKGLIFSGGNPAVISGTPAAGTGGVFTLPLSATDARGTGAQLLTLKIDEAPKITSAQIAYFHVGVKSSFAVSTLGFPSLSRRPNPTGTPSSPDEGLGMHFDVTGLPAGLTASNLNPQGFATSTLRIEGTPTAEDFGIHRVRIAATNGVGAPALQFLLLNVLQTALVPSSPTTCDGTYSGDYSGDIRLSSGQSCTFEGGSISGNVGGNVGGSLTLHGTVVGKDVALGNNRYGEGFDITGATIGGALHMDFIQPGPMPDQICATHIKGSRGLALIGNSATIAAGSSGCAGNIIDSRVEVFDNPGKLTFDGNQVQSNLDVHDSKGSTQLFHNTIAGALSCYGDSSLSGGDNTASQKLGQCASF